MSLSVGNRAKVLSAQGLCIACAGKHGAGKVCSTHWIGAKRPKSIRCCYIDSNSNEQCNYHISLCKDHLDFNIKELKGITKKLNIPRYPVNHHKLDLNVDNSHLEPSGVLHTQSSAPLSTRELDPDHGRALVDPEGVTTPTPPGFPRAPPDSDTQAAKPPPNPVPAQPPTMLSHSFGYASTSVTAKAAIDILHDKAISSDPFELARALSFSYIDDTNTSVCPYPSSNPTLSSFST